jgi:DNA polymerase III subunit chi
MAKVDFHSGVADPLNFACRLLRKAYGAGAGVVVTAPASTLQALDRELWTFDAHEFVPHVRVRPGQLADAALRRTPIWLCEGAPAEPCPKVLVNLGAEAPQRLEPFERIIEIVPTDAPERQRARSRWRSYEARGLAITHHPQPASS